MNLREGQDVPAPSFLKNLDFRIFDQSRSFIINLYKKKSILTYFIKYNNLFNLNSNSKS